jgi:hypothetical protein
MFTMDKNRKHHRDKGLPAEELEEFSPPGTSSFNTEEGRAAQGMREDLGGDPEKAQVEPRDDAQPELKTKQ